MKYQQSAGIVPYKIDNETILYLLLRYNAGHWDLPKGKIESGETKQETALRELHEETGLTAILDDTFDENIQYIFTDYDKKLTKKTVYFFVGQTNNDKIKLSHEHIDFAWLPYDKALKQLTYNNAKSLLKKAHKYISSNLKRDV